MVVPFQTNTQREEMGERGGEGERDGERRLGEMGLEYRSHSSHFSVSRDETWSGVYAI